MFDFGGVRNSWQNVSGLPKMGYSCANEPWGYMYLNVHTRDRETSVGKQCEEKSPVEGTKTFSKRDWLLGLGFVRLC